MTSPVSIIDFIEGLSPNCKMCVCRTNTCLREVDIRFFGHLCSAKLGQVMLGGLDGLMPQGLTDNLDGLVLIFQRQGKAVTGSIYCNVLLTLRIFSCLAIFFREALKR